MKLSNSIRTLASTVAVFLACSLPGVATAGLYTVDNLLASTTLADSGDAIETAWAEGVLGLDSGSLTISKIEDPTVYSNYSSTSDAEFYLDVDPNEPAWFLLKFGVGQTGANTHYLFENIAELTKLVWSNSQVQGLMSNTECFLNGTCSLERLSHASLFNGGTVPEPSTLALVGLALIAAGKVRRRTQ